MKTRLNPLVNLMLLIMPVLVLIGLVIYIQSGENVLADKQDSSAFQQIEVVASETIPFSMFYKQLGIDIRYATGERLQDGIFVVEDGLMKNFENADDEIRRTNNKALEKFSEYANEKETFVYFALIPTAGGVLQKRLPYSSNRINQRNIIENTYNQLGGKLTSVNVYNTLSENQDKYIFYRTEDGLTSFGGYYVYRELIRRMLSESEIKMLSDYNVGYENGYLGSLYNKVPYRNIKPDVLSFYYEKQGKDYQVVVGEEKKAYFSLYPKGQEISIASYVGGAEEFTEIYSEQDSSLKLLVIGDNSAAPFLPFLADHYSRITFINISDQQTGNAVVDDYDQVLIAIKIENYTGSNDMGTVLGKLL